MKDNKKEPMGSGELGKYFTIKEIHIIQAVVFNILSWAFIIVGIVCLAEKFDSINKLGEHTHFGTIAGAIFLAFGALGWIGISIPEAIWITKAYRLKKQEQLKLTKEVK